MTPAPADAPKACPLGNISCSDANTCMQRHFCHRNATAIKYKWAPSAPMRCTLCNEFPCKCHLPSVGPLPAAPAQDVGEYPTLARLADISRTTVGYQKPDLEREAVAAFRELTRLRAALAKTEHARDSAVRGRELLRDLWRKRGDQLDAANARADAKDAVPREPTVAMLQAANVTHAICGKELSGCTLGEVWRAMYDAARSKP